MDFENSFLAERRRVKKKKKKTYGCKTNNMRGLHKTKVKTCKLGLASGADHKMHFEYERGFKCRTNQKANSKIFLL